MLTTKGFHFMKKFRTLGFGIAIAAGLAMFGTGVATAQEPETGGGQEETTTGSADGLAALLESLATGSAGAEEPATEDATAINEDEDETGADTGSASGLAALLEALTSGSAGAEEPETDPVD
ncbi:hypothetical protein [Nocardia sp. NPDC060259]|uniref:hypothetical protein n=1 Tax=Nocardia sp. NPDC060259 TaxID=3347088 RepID=UPI003657897B